MSGIRMEMHEGKYTKQTSSDFTSLAIDAADGTAQETRDVVIVNKANNGPANCIESETKEGKMDPAVEQPLVLDDPVSSGSSKRNGISTDNDHKKQKGT